MFFQLWSLSLPLSLSLSPLSLSFSLFPESLPLTSPTLYSAMLSWFLTHTTTREIPPSFLLSITSSPSLTLLVSHIVLHVQLSFLLSIIIYLPPSHSLSFTLSLAFSWNFAHTHFFFSLVFWLLFSGGKWYKLVTGKQKKRPKNNFTSSLFHIYFTKVVTKSQFTMFLTKQSWKSDLVSFEFYLRISAAVHTRRSASLPLSFSPCCPNQSFFHSFFLS